MRLTLPACSLLLLLAAAGIAPAATMRLDDDGMAVVHGHRSFILGLYEHPKEDAVLDEVAAAGFNLVRAAENTEALDRLHARGLWAWVNTGGKIDLSANPEQNEQRLRAMADSLGKHPALAVWEVPDEALWNTWYLPTQWRDGEEPRLLTERIAGVENSQRRAALQQQLNQSRALRHQGLYAESERLADALWEQLGETSPKPGFGLADAEERAGRLAEGMYQGYRLLRRLDPERVVWMNHAPRNQIEQLALFNRAADIVSCDIYPVPESLQVKHSDLADRTLSSVGAYTRRMQAAAPDKPVWMVLQGVGWGDFLKVSAAEKEHLRRPTREETRFMAYDAIANGAQGILYWGSDYVEKDSDFWKELLAVIEELSGLQSVLAAPDALPDIQAGFAPTYGSVDRGIVVRAKDAPDGIWLIVVNEWTGPLTAVLRGLESLEGQRFEDTAAGASATVENGVLTLPMRAHSVCVLAPR